MVSSHTFSLFFGAFSLLNITRTQNGTEVPNTTYGDKPVGLISYTAPGYMSAVLTSSTPADRPLDLTLPFTAAQSDAEWALVGKHSLGYAGPFVVNEGKAEVVHGPLLTATLPEFVGSEQKREYEFFNQGKVLKLTGNLGNGIVDVLFWERLERNITVW